MAGEEAAPVYDVAEIEKRIQGMVLARRIRLKDIFRDYDPRRSWRCTKNQFIRVLDNASLKILYGEAAALADAYTDEGTGEVRYGKFSDNIDKVFGPKHLEATPLQEVDPPGTDIQLGYRANQLRTVDDEEILAYVLHRVSLLCRTRGISIKECFRWFDRQNQGCVTEQQFRRSFPFEGFTEQELDVLVERYTDRDRSVLNGVNYRTLHHDVMDREEAALDPPYPRSDLVLRPDSAEWTDADHTPEEKVQARVVERRIRIREWFSDYDPLRKGYCTAGQARSILSLLNVPVAQKDWDALCEKYMRETVSSTTQNSATLWTKRSA